MNQKYVVTGGGGFLGSGVVRLLLCQGHEVVAVGRNKYPELERLGALSVQADIGTESQKLSGIFRGADGVFHTAAKVDMWGPYDEFVRTNVSGTQAVVNACLSSGVKKLVFTSSPSVVAGGSDLKGVNESTPMPKKFEAYYPETKAKAEQLVSAVHGVRGLKTVSLRPHLIWGPRDTNLIPTVLERARAGKLVRIGAGENLSDFTYIDDCVQAHLLAMQALEDRPDAVGGKAYFITQGDPVRLWWWIDEILKIHGVKPINRSIPANAALAVATVSEIFTRLCNRCGSLKEPLLTKFLVKEMAQHHYFSIDAAKRDLGYQPSRTTEEALGEYRRFLENGVNTVLRQKIASRASGAE